MKKYIVFTLLTFIAITCIGENETAINNAKKQKETAICQLKSTKCLLKTIRSTKSVDNHIIINSEKYDSIIEQYGSECEVCCLDINEYVVSISDIDNKCSYKIDKKKLEKAIKNQIKQEKCTKREKCKCYRKIKHK